MKVTMKDENSDGEFYLKTKPDYNMVIGILSIYRDELKPALFVNPPPFYRPETSK